MSNRRKTSSGQSAQIAGSPSIEKGQRQTISAAQQGLITDLEIRNFRSLRKLDLPNLARINLLSGKNNVGKTTLLEAIFMMFAPNAPELTIKLMAFRGMEQLATDADSMWGSFFSDNNTQNTIRLVAKRGKESIDLQLRLSEPKTARPLRWSATDSAAPSGLVNETLGPRDLILEYRDSRGKFGESKMFFAEGVPKADKATVPKAPPAVFLSTHARFPAEDAERFSALRAHNQHREVEETLRLLEPRLVSLSVLSANRVPMLYGDIGLPTLVPIPLMGEGVVRLLSILLAIAYARDGAVLVDEVERGFHHSVLRDVWSAIATAVARSNTQLFATTHSFECISAAFSGLKAPDVSPTTFMLHRLERRSAESDVVVVDYDDESLSSALDSELEVR